MRQETARSPPRASSELELSPYHSLPTNTMNTESFFLQLAKSLLKNLRLRCCYDWSGDPPSTLIPEPCRTCFWYHESANGCPMRESAPASDCSDKIETSYPHCRECAYFNKSSYFFLHCAIHPHSTGENCPDYTPCKNKHNHNS